MPSDLQITNIRDQANANSAITIASDGQITVNQNNPTLTLGSNTTFPAGHVIQTKIHSEQEDIESTDNTTATATSSSCALNCTSGNVLLVWVTGGYTYSAYASSGMETGITILTSGDSTTRLYITSRYSSNNSVTGWVGSSFVSLSVSATQTYTIKRAVKRVDGSGTVRWNTDGEADTCYWTMMEVKPTS